MRIRKATLDDGEGMAYVKVHSWKTTYRGFFPDEILDNLSVETTTQRWSKVVLETMDDEKNPVLVAENDKGKTVGFAAGVKHEEKNSHYDCEIRAIYVLKEFQGKGIGTKLVEKMVEFFITKNCKTMIIWVLKGNPYSRFYGKLGGIKKEKKVEEYWGKKYTIEGFVWDNIEKILSQG
ncbi:MAG: GNAT family N-acetyltransferase [Candidatus Heimdallarchaeaceae archaeon]